MKQGLAIRILTYAGDIDWVEDQLSRSKLRDGDVFQTKKGKIICREVVRPTKIDRATRQYYRRLFIWQEEDTFPALVATLSGFFVDLRDKPLGPFPTLFEAKANRIDFCREFEEVNYGRHGRYF